MTQDYSMPMAHAVAGLEETSSLLTTWAVIDPERREASSHTLASSLEYNSFDFWISGGPDEEAAGF